jgi:hypothetical protein
MQAIEWLLGKTVLGRLVFRSKAEKNCIETYCYVLLDTLHCVALVEVTNVFNRTKF